MPTRVDRKSGDYEEQESESEEKKSEKAFIHVVRSIRNKLTARKLDGSIYIRRVCGVIATAMNCKIQSSSSIPELYEEDDLTDLPSQYQRAITTTDLILDSLERRSLGWEGVNFSDEVTITRGALIGVSDPFFGLVNWSVTVEVTATVKSLLVSRKRYEMIRAISASRSSFRFPLFSLSNTTSIVDKSLPSSLDEPHSDVSKEELVDENKSKRSVHY
jgi:hypothetical protein